MRHLTLLVASVLVGCSGAPATGHDRSSAGGTPPETVLQPTVGGDSAGVNLK